MRCLQMTLAVGIALAAGSGTLRAQGAQIRADTSATSSHVADSLARDSLARGLGASDTLRTRPGVGIVSLADSVKAKFDSVAVASLSDTTGAFPSELSEGTPVYLFGRTLFKVYGALGDLSEADRAERVTQRLEQLASNPNVSMDSLSVVDGQDFTTIQLGNVIVMTITGAEAKAELLPRYRVALSNAETIQEAVARYRAQRTTRGLIRSAVISVLLLILLVVLLRVLAVGYHQFEKRTQSLRTALIRPIVFRGNILVSRSQIEGGVNWFLGVVRVAISLVLIYLFLTTVFGLFPWTQAWSERLLSYAIAPVAALGKIIVDGLPNLLAIVVIVVLVRWLIKVSNFFFGRIRREEFHIPGFHPELAEPTRRIARFLLLVLGFMLVYPYTPIADSPVFQGLTVFFGILLSLGSSSAISNIIAGIVLTYTRAFRLGDRVKMGDTTGDVIEKTFLVTRIRTPKNEDVAVPNSMALSGHIINYSERAREAEGVILYTTVTIGYDVPWPRVHELLIEAAMATEGFEKEPPPFVLQTALGDFSVSYQINAYTKNVNAMARLYSELHAAIQDAFHRADIEILSPRYEAHRDGNPPTTPVRSDLGPSAEVVSGGADGKAGETVRADGA